MPEGYSGLPPYYVQSSSPITANLGLSLKGCDPVVAENFYLIDTAFGSVSATIEVNGAVIPPVPNFNNTTPAAPAGNVNVTWQVSGSNISAYVPISGSGSAFPTRFVTVSSAYTAVAGDFVLCNTSGGGFTVTLPPSAANAKANICVKKTSSDQHVLTLAASLGDNIDQQSSWVIIQQGTAVYTTADGGTEWWIY